LQGLSSGPGGDRTHPGGYPEVQDAAVIAEAHTDFGEVPVAYVVLRSQAECTAEALIEYAAKGLAKYKRPAKVVFIDAIPRSPSGKILRRLLKDGHIPRQENIGQSKIHHSNWKDPPWDDV
jgi:acyl-CoA synthetase (AMP-forming)/AMP-acid ligase II